MEEEQVIEDEVDGEKPKSESSYEDVEKIDE